MYRKNYRRRNYRRRRYPRRRQQGTNWTGLAKKAWKTAKWVASVVNVEYKQVGINQSTTNNNYNGVVYELITPAQGSANNQRTGDSIKCKNLTIRGQIQYDTIAENCRVMLVMDKENSIATGANLLQTTGSVLATLSQKDNDNYYKSKILWDKVFTVNANMPIRTFNKVFKLDFHTHFEAGSTTIEDGSLKLVFFGQTNGAAGASQHLFVTEVSYIDN